MKRINCSDSEETIIPLLHAEVHLQQPNDKMIAPESEEAQKRCEEDIQKHLFRYLGTMRGVVKFRNFTFYFIVSMILFVVIFQLTSDLQEETVPVFRLSTQNHSRPLIIVITPTYKRLTRLADMLRMSNTLSHIRDLHWIVIEDGTSTKEPVENILKRTGISYTYLAYQTIPGYPKKGWYQRTMALNYLRSNTSEILGSHDSGVVYFGDDDNAYDIRLFTDYIRNVKVLGMWAVGLVGGTVVEAPHVENGKVTSFDVRWNPKRIFAVDMAGFAVNLNVVLKTTAVFGTRCRRGSGAPETCLLQDMKLTREDIEPFGFESPNNREILVWHTKTARPNLPTGKDSKTNNTRILPSPLEKYGFIVEI